MSHIYMMNIKDILMKKLLESINKQSQKKQKENNNEI
jgi:hypothetical protein